MYKNKKELTASFEKYPAHIDKNAFKVILQKIKWTDTSSHYDFIFMTFLYILMH